MSQPIMPSIARLKRLKKKRDIIVVVVVNLILGYNDHYIYFEEVITYIPLLSKHHF
jgi:hypothetical protein